MAHKACQRVVLDAVSAGNLRCWLSGLTCAAGVVDAAACAVSAVGVLIRWNGLVEWNGGMEYWNSGMRTLGAIRVVLMARIFYMHAVPPPYRCPASKGESF